MGGLYPFEMADIKVKSLEQILKEKHERAQQAAQIHKNVVVGGELDGASQSVKRHGTESHVSGQLLPGKCWRGLTFAG